MTNENIKLPSGWIGVESIRPIEFKPNRHEIEVIKEMTTFKIDYGTNYKIVSKYIDGHALAEMRRS